MGIFDIENVIKLIGIEAEDVWEILETRRAGLFSFLQKFRAEKASPELLQIYWHSKKMNEHRNLLEIQRLECVPDYWIFLRNL